VDATVAALIGTGVGFVTTIAAQLIAHRLGVQRDRSSERRTRLYEVVVEASLALSGPLKDPRRDPSASTFDAVFGGFPRKLADLQDGVARALVLLEVHFGHNHQILRDYSAAYDPIYQAATVMVSNNKPDDWLDILRAGKQAATTFVAQARAHVERI
jgi:hypothetical protein